MRTCQLIRLLARFSCRALQQVWCKSLKNLVESLIVDNDQCVRLVSNEIMIKIKQIRIWASGGLKCRFVNTYEIYF